MNAVPGAVKELAAADYTRLRRQGHFFLSGS